MGIFFLALFIGSLCLLALGALLLLCNKRQEKKDRIAPVVLLLSGAILALACIGCFI